MEQTAAEQKDVRTLVIESSCDETAAVVVENGRTVRLNVIYSQITMYTFYGGVVPRIALHTYIERISQVTAQILMDADPMLAEIDAIGVTYGPGLMGPLLIDVSVAKAMAFTAGKLLIGVSRIEGYASADFIANPDLKPPLLCLIVSGGHTSLAMVEDYGKLRILGQTRDDATGGAFDKVARPVGLGYPGGLKIDRRAREDNPGVISFPRAKVAGSPYDLNLSGLKSAVLNYQSHAKVTGEETPAVDLVASFQKAVVEILVSHTMEITQDFNCKTIAMAGDVAANSAFRKAMWLAYEAMSCTLTYPEFGLYTDNVAMIGSTAYYEYCAGRRSGWGPNAVPNLRLGGR